MYTQRQRRESAAGCWSGGMMTATQHAFIGLFCPLISGGAAMRERGLAPLAVLCLSFLHFIPTEQARLTVSMTATDLVIR
jgi:hypothetical protein